MIITQSTMFSIYLISQANGSVLGNEKLAWRLFFDKDKSRERADDLSSATLDSVVQLENSENIMAVTNPSFKKY